MVKLIYLSVCSMRDSDYDYEYEVWTEFRAVACDFVSKKQFGYIQSTKKHSNGQL